MFLCYDIIRDVPRLRSLSRSFTISSKVNATKPAERTIRGFELTHMQSSGRQKSCGWIQRIYQTNLLQEAAQARVVRGR